MFKSWRVQLREAEQAVRAGRLDDAVRLVQEPELQESLPGRRLAVAVAEQLARRAQQRVRDTDAAGGWRDLVTACGLAADAPSVLAIRRQVWEETLGEAQRQLAAGESVAAIKRLELADRHQPGADGIRPLLEVARRVESARNLQTRGKFEEAEHQLERAAWVAPEAEVVRSFRELYRQQARQARGLSEQLHQAMSRGDWTEVLSVAGKLLEISPQSGLADEARRRAWLAVGASPQPRPGISAAPLREPGDRPQPAPGQAGAELPWPASFLLWVDGVGGFLVCLEDEIVLGQASAGNRVGVPILGDLSRQHAIIRREDGYLIEPLGEVWVDGRQIHRTTALSDGEEIRLGRSVVLRFRQPHPLSATARLELLSRHRTQPSADAVLLMAESCVLGPKWQNHVVCRDWSSDVVLYRREGALYCRATEAMEVDGRFCEGQERLEWDSHVSGSDFSLSLERLG